MSKFSNVVTYEKDCTERCKSNEHGSYITCAITKRSITDKQLASFIKSVCSNFSQVSTRLLSTYNSLKLLVFLKYVMKSK